MLFCSRIINLGTYLGEFQINGELTRSKLVTEQLYYQQIIRGKRPNV